MQANGTRNLPNGPGSGATIICMKASSVQQIAKGTMVLDIIFWDIDGTLIRTGKAGLFAFQ